MATPEYLRRPNAQRGPGGEQARQGASGRPGGPQSQANRGGGTSRGGRKGPFQRVGEAFDRARGASGSSASSGAGPRTAAGSGSGSGGGTSTATGKARSGASALNRGLGRAADTGGKWARRAASTVRGPAKAVGKTAGLARSALSLGSLGAGALGTAAYYGLPAADRTFGGNVGDAAAENVDGEMGSVDDTRQRRSRLRNFQGSQSREAPAMGTERGSLTNSLRRGEGTGRGAAYEPPAPGGAVPESARASETGQGEPTFEELAQIGRDAMAGIGPDQAGTSGPATIRSAPADTQRAQELQRQSENYAPPLEGDPSEQEVITAEDGQGGTASIRAPAGMREGGGGNVSFVDGDVAAAAVPVDRTGLRRARQAAADRGDWEAVERSYMNPQQRRMAERESRREQLRDVVSSSQGMDQSVGGMMQEGIRRQAAQQELATMEAEDTQMRERQASLRRALMERQPTAMERAEYLQEQRQQQLDNQREETEAQRAQREENREVVDRAAERTDPESGDTYVDTTLRNRIESLGQRLSGEGEPDSQAIQQIGDMVRTTEELNAEAEESWETPIVGDLVDWFRTGPSTSRQAEVGDMVQSLRNLKEAGVRQENRSRRGAPWPFEKDVVTWRGQDLNLNEIPAGEREVLHSLIDRIPDSVTQGDS